MTGGARRDDADLPIIDAVEPREGDAAGARSMRERPSQGGIQRALAPRVGPGKGAGLAAAALGLLVVAIAVGGFSLAPEPTATPNGSGLETPHPSTDASAATEAPCLAPRQGQFPPVTMSSTNSRRVLDGLFVAGSGYGQQEGTPGWRVPPLAAAARPAAGSMLEFRAGQQTCFRHLRIEYIDTATAPDGLVRVWLDATRPPTRTVSMDLLPEGDWLVRVTAHFETLVQTSTTDIVTVTNFRVIVGSVPVVTDPPVASTLPGPDRTPVVPCGTAIPSADIGVELVSSSGMVTLGSASGGDLAADASTRPGDSLRVIVDGETCATGWDLTLFDVAKGEGMLFDSYRGRIDDPSIAAENRWAVPATFSESLLTAVLRFPGGLEISRYWRIYVDPFLPPPLFLIGSDGTTFEATAGCSLSVQLSNGYSYDNGCPTAGYVEDADALHVAAFSVVHADLKGWSIIGWRASCGRMSDDGLDFESPGGCGLGGGSADDGAGVPQRVAFFLRPGDHVVQVDVGAVDAHGNSFTVSYFAHVIAR